MILLFLVFFVKKCNTEKSVPTVVVSDSTISVEAAATEILANMVYVEGGTFTMGATSEQGSEAASDEKTTLQITLNSFHLGKYEVTQAEWEALMGCNPSEIKGANLPVENVSWDDCQEYIRKLNSLMGKKFRLPSEAEWEYAARGGSKSMGYKYAGGNVIGDVAWYENNSDETTHAVGLKHANELGLYDMAGNVFEWCKDLYTDNYIMSAKSETPNVASNLRVLRGGSCSSAASVCRLSYRREYNRTGRYTFFGLRLAL